MLQVPQTPPTPFFRPLCWNRGVGALGILPTPAAHASFSTKLAPIPVMEALAQLELAGLVASATRGAEIHILGGTSMSADSGIPVYDEAFAIFAEPTGGFFAGVSGPGQVGEDVQVETLADAVDVVLRIYRDRGKIGGARGPA
jgi:hypothetical protein